MTLNIKRDDFSLVFTTESNLENAKKLAKDILKKKLASCVSFHKINSIYWWEDELNENLEIQIIIKTKSKYIDLLYDFFKKNHSYKLPEFIFLNASCSQEYINWVEINLVNQI